MVLSQDERRAFAILELPPTATRDEVKRAHRDLVRRWHPDQYANDPIGLKEAHRRMAIINQAYHTVATVLVDTSDAVAHESTLAMPGREVVASSLARNQIDEIVRAIIHERSWAWEWSNPSNRVAVRIAAIWVTVVAGLSWFGPTTDFDPVVGRALAPWGPSPLRRYALG